MTRLALVLVFLVALGGCRRPVLNEDRQFELTRETPYYTFTVEPIKQAQTIKVKATADEPVTVMIGLKKDEEVLPKEAYSGKFTDKTLAKEVKTKDASLEAPIPANESAIVIVVREANKATKIRLKVTNQ
jgi:hypothetical protein